jgi:hypothetical protein
MRAVIRVSERERERDGQAIPLSESRGGGLQNRRSQVRALSPLSAFPGEWRLSNGIARPQSAIPADRYAPLRTATHRYEPRRTV